MSISTSVSTVAHADFVGSDHGAELTLILVDAQAGHGPALHRHPYEEIFVVYGGTRTFFVDGSQVQAGAGDVVLSTGWNGPPLHQLRERSFAADGHLPRATLHH